MVAMSVVTGAQAHGLGYWGPDAQIEIVRQSFDRPLLINLEIIGHRRAEPGRPENLARNRFDCY
jgi:hypothetical protein